MGSAALTDALERVESVRPATRRAERAAARRHEGVSTTTWSTRCHESGLYRAFVPLELGGLGLTLPDGVEVVRAVSTFDASVGWAFGITSGGPLFGRLLDEDEFKALFSEPRVAVAGSLNPLTGRAEPVDGGFRFTGTAQYASGCKHATWIVAGRVGSSRRTALVRRRATRAGRRRDPDGRGAHQRHLVGDRHASDRKQRLHDRPRRRARGPGLLVVRRGAALRHRNVRADSAPHAVRSAACGIGRRARRVAHSDSSSTSRWRSARPAWARCSQSGPTRRWRSARPRG